jgi:hypothetical protein
MIRTGSGNYAANQVRKFYEVYPHFKPEYSIWLRYSVTQTEKINSRLAVAKHADRMEGN